VSVGSVYTLSWMSACGLMRIVTHGKADVFVSRGVYTRWKTSSALFDCKVGTALHCTAIVIQAENTSLCNKFPELGLCIYIRLPHLSPFLLFVLHPFETPFPLPAGNSPRLPGLPAGVLWMERAGDSLDGTGGGGC